MHIIVNMNISNIVGYMIALHYIT